MTNFIILNISLFVIGIFFIKMSNYIILNISLFVIGILFIIINNKFLVLPQFSPWISSWIFPTNHKDIKNCYLVFGVIAGLFLILGICDPSISHCIFDPCNPNNYPAVVQVRGIPEEIRVVGQMLQTSLSERQAVTVNAVSEDGSIWKVISYSKEWLANHKSHQGYSIAKRRIPGDVLSSCQERYQKFRELTVELNSMHSKHKLAQHSLNDQTSPATDNYYDLLIELLLLS